VKFVGVVCLSAKATKEEAREQRRISRMQLPEHKRGEVAIHWFCSQDQCRTRLAFCYRHRRESRLLTVLLASITKQREMHLGMFRPPRNQYPFL